ncbi:MAG: PAS domain-containing protein, partial [Anaerolineae bacterium]|nr:PAS domain-containing protein [Anaerolineae bacterium]
MFDSTADGILAVDRTGKITTFNRKFAELWNIPESVMAARDDRAAIATVLDKLEDPVAFEAKINALYARPQEHSDDLLKLRNGRVIARHSQPQWLQDDIIGRVWVFRDVTAQIQAEEALEQERNLLRAVVDTLPYVIFAKDAQGRKILSNLGDQAAMGVQSETEAFGKTDFEIYSQELAEKYAAEDRPVLEEGRVLDIENPYIDPTGQQHWLAGSKRPFKNQAGEIVGLVGMFHDVTSIKQAEDEREALIAELETNNAELERFVYTVSHDLKSPLITIKGFLGFLEQDAAGNAERFRHDIDLIADAVDKMQQLLDELLELSRIGRLNNPPEQVQITGLAHEAAATVAGTLREGGVQVDIAPDMPVVVGDRTRLREVFENLIGNAAKFMGDQPQPQIDIGARESDGEPVFYVRDNGIGIEPQYQNKIFDLFEKLDPTSEGTGIGLAIVKRIVETHG